MRILIVDDELRLAETLGQIMIENKYLVDIINDGETGYDYAMSGIYDVIILDVMLPKMNGFDIVRKMRANKEKTPVILLTARDEVIDKITGLDCGADDYLTKPFSTEELLARVRALSRRQGAIISNELNFGDLVLNQSTNTLFCGAKSVRLGLKEFEILRLLMSNPNNIITKEDLLLKVWGSDSNAEDNNVEVYISFLRKKLFFLDSRVSIETVRKIGYHLGEKIK
ncbi:response regulator transcription factor [Clostridium sp. BL-8]|uniref:response regulator transcription factor n=1 Tax=Clostridium sp. BL-8 TaxID=349938 RepID=UPI00098CC206|nr:response regulator transcription factor [Clostridium sp. BL-8]OOM73748.1 transcriptional regulatory protein TcrA [Clostridium sp. BL-8]